MAAVPSEVKLSGEVKQSAEAKQSLDKPLIFSQPQKKDFLLSPPELRKLSDSGDIGAQLMLGMCIRWGLRGCKINEPEGTKLIELASKSENTPAGLLAKSLCYKEAFGGILIKNPDKAMELCAEAAKSGYIPALTELACQIGAQSIKVSESIISTPGITSNIKLTKEIKDYSNLSLAVSLLLPGAEAGYEYALLNLGACYVDGNGVAPDPKEGFKLIMMAAKTDCARAKVQVGNCYEYGLGGVESSRSQAREWYKAAESQGADVREELRRTTFGAVFNRVMFGIGR